MDNQNTASIENYAGLLLQISNLLNSSFEEVKNKFKDYPHSEIYYFEKDKKDKSIEIRFDEKEIMIICTFNPHEICDCIFLYPDRKETNDELIIYLGKVYKYDFLHTVWITPSYYIKIKKVVQSINDVCFMIIARS